MHVISLNQTDNTEDCDNNESIVFFVVYFHDAFIIRGGTSALKCHVDNSMYSLFRYYKSIFMYII
jgi:hypothetical protein